MLARQTVYYSNNYNALTWTADDRRSSLDIRQRYYWCGDFIAVAAGSELARRPPWPGPRSCWARRTRTRTWPCPRTRRPGTGCPARCWSSCRRPRRSSRRRWRCAVCRPRSTAACARSRPSPALPRPRSGLWSPAAGPARSHPAACSPCCTAHRRRPHRYAAGSAPTTARFPRCPASRSLAAWRCSPRPTPCPPATATARLSSGLPFRRHRRCLRRRRGQHRRLPRMRSNIKKKKKLSWEPKRFVRTHRPRPVRCAFAVTLRVALTTARARGARVSDSAELPILKSNLILPFRFSDRSGPTIRDLDFCSKYPKNNPTPTDWNRNPEKIKLNLNPGVVY